MMAITYNKNKLSGFYPNCAEGRNPFSFRKNNWMVFHNIGEIESFINHIRDCFKEKTYSKSALKIQKGLKFLDL